MKNLAVPLDQLNDRRQLARAARCRSQIRRVRPTATAAWTPFTTSAFDVLTSSKLVDALDVTKEPEPIARSLWPGLAQASRRWRTDVERSAA